MARRRYRQRLRTNATIRGEWSAGAEGNAIRAAVQRRSIPRDRLILVRSVTESELNTGDLKARIVAHFQALMPQMADIAETLVELCQFGVILKF